MKKVLWAVTALAVIAALIVCVGRIQVEKDNSAVEIVYDYNALEKLAGQIDQDISTILRTLHDAGVSSIGVSPLSVGEMLLLNQPVPPKVEAYLQEHVDELDKLVTLPVQFDPAEFETVRAAGMEVVPRLNNAPWDIPQTWVELSPSLVVLGGKESPGYPDELEDTARLISESGASVGVVEFAAQAGVDRLGAPEQMVRVHGINEKEMLGLSADRIVARYVRAVRERNIRVIYVRPFPEGDQAWERSVALLHDLTAALNKAGFSVGKNAPFAGWEVPRSISVLLWAGIWASAVLYAAGFIVWPSWVFFALWIAGTVGTIGLSAVNFTLAQQGMALLAAIVFPCLALRENVGRRVMTRYISAALISLAGALLIVGTLTGTEYLIKMVEFRGVKAMHVLPIGLVFLTGLLQPLLPIKGFSQLGRWLRKWWDFRFPAKYLVFAGLAGMAGLVYLLRTGNFGISAPAMEIMVREFLENVLVARPRTKEFLIGHPALYFALRSRSGKFPWWLPIAVIGQLSMVNTFTHIHTPVLISLARTIYGLVFGYIIGWLAFRIYSFLKELFDSDRDIWLSRIQKSRGRGHSSGTM